MQYLIHAAKLSEEAVLLAASNTIIQNYNITITSIPRIKKKTIFLNKLKPDGLLLKLFQ